jgi:hypothetical protein
MKIQFAGFGLHVFFETVSRHRPLNSDHFCVNETRQRTV